jgi:hypothetical protein
MATTPNQFKTNVGPKDITFLKDGSVAIKSTGLLNAFVHSAPHAIAKLASDVALTSIDNVHIDDSGRIVIDDPQFVEAIKRKLAQQRGKTTGDTNTVCKNAFKCGIA